MYEGPSWLKCPRPCDCEIMSPLVPTVVSDLCATGDHDCEQVCVSSSGSYTCACREGFTLNSDGKTCNGEWAAHRQPQGGWGRKGWGLGCSLACLSFPALCLWTVKVVDAF